MNKYLGYGTTILALVALVVSLVALGSVGDEAMGLHPGYTIEQAAEWGSDGSGYDVTFNSETAGDLLLWDASDVALEITGTAAQDAINVADGNVSIVDDLDVDGTTNLDAVDVDGAADFASTITANGAIISAVDLENIGGVPSVVSAAITYESSGALFTVGAGEVWVVHHVLVNVTTNFDCTGSDCTLTIGDGNDPDGFIVLADAEMQAADTELTGAAAGWQGMAAATRGVYLDEVTTNAYVGGFVYDGTDTIDIVIGGTDPAAGAGTVYVIYTRLQ